MEDYSSKHRNRQNLLIHLVAVPSFVLGLGGLALAVSFQEWLLLVPGLVLPLVSLALQGRGHRLEASPPAPFRSPWDFVFRILREQFVLFPLFVLRGRWAQAWRAEGERA
jgi:hypothetical protein